MLYLDITPDDFAWKAVGAKLKLLAYKAWPQDGASRLRFLGSALRDRVNIAAADAGATTSFNAGFNGLRLPSTDAMEQLLRAMPLVVHGSSAQHGAAELRAGEVAAGLLLAGIELHSAGEHVSQSRCIDMEMERLGALMGARRVRDFARHWSTHRSVAHLWAASHFALQKDPTVDISGILLFAEGLADAASEIDFGRGRRLLDPATSWRLPPLTREWLARFG